MKKKRIMLIVIVIITIVLSYFTGCATCDEHYKQYYNATETLLDSIDEDYFMDVIMEGDEYQDYLTAKENL